MKSRTRREVEGFVESQKSQLGLNEAEAKDLLRQSLKDIDEEETQEFEQSEVSDAFESKEIPPQRDAPSMGSIARKKIKKRRSKMSDPYLSESRTIKTRPTRISKIRSILFELALPNEYIVPIGVKHVKPLLGGKFFKIGRRFLKFPAAVQTVYFASDNANKNYQGLRIDGYACWRVDPEKPEIAARSLDFSDQNNPMGNTNRILRTICTEAIRHIIANITIEDSLTKKDEIGLDLKNQLERIEREWGIIFDQVGIERVTILSSDVFNDLQQKTRDDLRLTAAESRMETNQKIQKKESEYTQEIEALSCRTEKEARIMRAATNSEIHKVEIDEKSKREAANRKADEERRKAESEAAERAAEQKAEQIKRQAAREAEININAAEMETKIADAKARNEMMKAEIENKRKLKEQELEAKRSFHAFEKEYQLETERLSAQIEIAETRLEQALKERRSQSQLDHEIEMNKIERMKLEEQIQNLISANRVMDRLVQNLPDIVSSMEIDRYTVLDSKGNSPLAHTLMQIFTLLDEYGLRNLLKKNKMETDDKIEDDK